MLPVLVLSLFLAIQHPCDLNPSDECNAYRVAGATANLSLPDIALEAERGVFVYRAWLENGDYGPAVSFERAPDRPPELVVYGEMGQQIRKRISVTLWEEVQKRSRYAGRKLVSNGVSVSCVV